MLTLWAVVAVTKFLVVTMYIAILVSPQCISIYYFSMLFQPIRLCGLGCT